jgi:hypothetical protein
MQMNGIGFSLWSDKRGALAVGYEVKRTVLDVGEALFVEHQCPLAGMIQGFGGNRIAFGEAQDSLDPS